MAQKIIELERAERLAEAYKSPRTATLEHWEAVAEGKQYKGRPGWFDSCNVPIWDRAPCVKYLAVRAAVSSNVDLLLGENRYPAVTTRPDENEAEEDQEDGLGTENSEVVDRFLLAIKDEARLEPLLREQYTNAQTMGTAAIVYGARNGKLFADGIPAKYAEPKWDALGELISIEIVYPYIEHERISSGWQAVAKLYRRVITATTDTTFAPGECRQDGTMPAWTVQQTITHNLGFVPVIWYRHNAPSDSKQGFDGVPIHAAITDEITATDIGLSMRHEGALYCRPQLCEIGVSPGYNPTGTAGSMVARGTKNGGVYDPVTNPSTGDYHGGAPSDQGARRRGPGWVFQYDNPDAKVQAINTPGDALKALDENIRDLRTKICEALAWVPLDPDSVKFAATVSGKALEVLRERQLNRVSSDRETFGKQVIVELYSMLLRVVSKFGAGLRTPGIKKTLPIIATMAPSGQWVAPRISLKWPPYFRPSADDTQKDVDTTTKAYDAGFITKRTAVEKLARPFGIENVSMYLDQLEAEQQERDKRRDADQKAAITKLHAAGMTSLSEDDEGSDDDTETGERPGGGPKQTPPG